MGNTPPQPTQEQIDIKYLGSRYPFGDDELWKLYRAFHRLQGKRDGVQVESQVEVSKVSFLTDWAVECVYMRLPPPGDPNSGDAQAKLKEMKQERFMLMQAVEAKILPPGFSEQLERTNFSRPEDYLGMHGTDESRLERMKHDRMGRLEKFVEGVANLGRKGGRHALGVLFDCYAIEKESNSMTPGYVDGNVKTVVADFNQVLTLAYRLSLAAAFLEAANNGDDMAQWIPGENLDDTAIKGLGHSLVEFIKRKRIRDSPYGAVEDDPELDKGFVEKLDMQEFAESNLPMLSSALSFFMFHVFFPERPYPPSRTAFRFPKLSEESTFFTQAASPLLFSFASLSPSLGGSWHRLYTSSNDGLSFNRMQNALLGYGGPTLIIIRAISGSIFGAFTAAAWKESKDFYGTSDCFLYQLIPMTSVYRPSGNGTNYMYCNSEARSRGYDGQAHGIGFGGDIDTPRLFIAESFEDCVARSQDLTFDYGELLPKTEDGAMQQSFDIDSLEVWGVGGDAVVAEALGARHKQREITEANLRKARKVDKAAFLDDFRGGLIESKAFAHRDQIRGRDDAAVDERHGKGAYVYEK
jgi:hypothetical protein